MTPNKHHKNPCPICGDTNYSWGVVQDSGHKTSGFVADDETWAQRFFGQPEKARARHCGTCGNLQLFLLDTAPR